MATWHNQAEKGDIAETVLLPGDPLRAKYIAEKYLEDSICFNDCRLMYGYTGYYKGKRISIMATGMGIPSMGIYSYELINYYECKNLIRIGTAGGLQNNIKVNDIVLAMGACTDSNYAYQFELPGTLCATADFDLLKKSVDIAEKLNMNYHVGNVYSSDVLYRQEKIWKSWQQIGTLASEMETYALYCNALKYHAKALSILDVTVNLETKEEVSQNEIEKNLDKMIQYALEVSINI